MPQYCVNRNAQTTGEHEVHDLTMTRGCHPLPADQIDLGFHVDCRSAVRAASAHFPQVDGCRWCVPACHTR
jgi:hypothetical protein